MAVDWEGARVEDGEVWLAKAGQLLLCRPDEHVVHEQAVVGSRAHHTHLDARLQVASVKQRDRAFDMLLFGVGAVSSSWWIQSSMQLRQSSRQQQAAESRV